MKTLLLVPWLCLCTGTLAAAEGPRNLLSNGDFADGVRGWDVTRGERCQATPFDVAVGGFRRALRLKVRPEPGAVPWAIALRQNVNAFMDKGDRLLLRIWMRSPEACRVSAFVELNRDPWPKSVSQTVGLTPQWREYTFRGECLQDFSSGEAQMGLHLGGSAGTIEIAGVRLLDPDLAGRKRGRRPTAEEPRSLIVNGDFAQPLARTWYVGGGKQIRAGVVDAKAGPYRKAVRLACKPGRDAKPWTLQFGQQCTGTVYPGDAVYVRAWLRSPDRCRVAFIYELAQQPHTKSIEHEVILTPEWKEYRFMGRALQGFRPRQSQIKLFLGYDKGVIEIAGVRVDNYGEARAHTFDQTLDYWGGRRPGDAWRGPALARIEELRKGALAVQVLDAAGRPVRGARVTVRQKRHHFRFGSEVAAALLLDNADPDPIRYQKEVQRLYNTVVFGNDLKWVTSSESRLRDVERAVTWLKARDIGIRGHCLLWGNYRHLHRSARSLRGEALLEACKAHVTDYATRMRGKLYVWDVVNEARSNTEVWEELGWPRFADAFRWARSADPDVRLCYNDYAILGGTAKTRRGVAERIRYLTEQGAPLDALGLQAHLRPPLTPMRDVLRVLDEWAQFGKALEITEFDLSCHDDEVHGRYVRDFMTAVFSHPKVESFMMWGFWEGRHWRAGQGAAMFRLDWSKRPAQEAYEDLVLRQWWTDWRGTTGTDGTVRTRAFHGQHEVTATTGAKSVKANVQLAPGKPITLRLALK